MKFPFFRKSSSHHGSSASPDKILMGLTVLLCVIGIIMVYDSSVALAIRDFGDRFYYAKEQIKWFLAGGAILIVFSMIPYKTWYGLALPLLMATIALLLAVFIPGLSISAMGAKRWIDLGFTVLQPAEFAKLSLIIYLSAWFSSRERKRFGPFLFLMGTVVGLIMLEPDLGTSLVIVAIAILLYFFSDAPITHFAIIIPMIVAGALLLAVVSPYRFQRLTSFFDPGKDPLGASYQVRQATLAIGSGGVFGVGLGKSRQKYQYLPEANTDSIFAIIGEETGLVGTMGILLLYAVVVYRGFFIASKTEQWFGKLLALGISSWIAIQSGINIAANVALVPLTGIPLPLISYGGSSTIVMLAAIGILISISKTVRT